MSRFYKKRTQTEGMPPGTVVFIGQRKMEKPEMRFFVFGDSVCADSRPDTIPDLRTACADGSVAWLNVDGLHDTDFIRSIGEKYGLHPLIQEDLANTGQRAKFEEIDQHIFMTLKALELGEDGRIKSEQLGIVFDRSMICTFKETPSDLFDHLYNRLHTRVGRLRSGRPDYAAFAILDTVVDDYLFLMEELGQKIENLEISLLNEPADWMVSSINHYKRELNYLSKTVRPVREMVLDFYRSDSDIISERTRPFINDLLDLITHAIETIDSYRDMLSDYLHIYTARQNNKLSEIMRVLTVFSTIFIPLTFLAGVYGTNFEFVPEYQMKYGYYIFWGVCISVGGALFAYTKYRRWI